MELKTETFLPDKNSSCISVSDCSGGVRTARQDRRDRPDRRPGPDHGGDLQVVRHAPARRAGAHRGRHHRGRCHGHASRY